MFKKTLIAVAALAAFGTVSAANFTLYGTVDEGLFYSYEKAGDVKTHNLALKSGINAASKFGFKGTEDLGNGMKVGFKLENQFLADDGTLHSDRLFRREASLSLSGDFGTVSVGRMGGVGSSAGTYDIVYGYGDAFDGFDNNVGDGLVASGRYDNMVTYQTPKFAGVQATVQYSFKEDNVEDKTSREGSAAANRYAGAALTGDFGPFGVALAYEFQNYASVATPDVEDGHTVYLAGNYDCGFAKTFAMVQYFKGMQSAVKVDATSVKGIKGFGATVGTSFGLLGGDTTVAVYYANGTDEQKAAGAHEDDLSYIGASARYVYPLSKRTSVYVGAGMAKYETEKATTTDKTTIGQAYAGLTHNF